MILDVTHLVAFLGGALSGAAGHYLGTKYTEQRHKKENEIHKRKQFEHLKNIMPKLLEEILEDVKNDKTKTVREFFVLPNERVLLSTDKARFLYYEDKHENLQGKIDILESSSYVVDVTTGNASIYRMTEEFLDLLLKFGK